MFTEFGGCWIYSTNRQLDYKVPGMTYSKRRTDGSENGTAESSEMTLVRIRLLLLHHCSCGGHFLQEIIRIYPPELKLKFIRISINRHIYVFLTLRFLDSRTFLPRLDTLTLSKCIRLNSLKLSKPA
jgi:hypothetical protein